MKHLCILSSAAIILAFSSCGISNDKNQTNASSTHSSDTVVHKDTLEKGLIAKISINDVVAADEPVELTFTVYNRADTVQRFCKWHTPFEPFISKYLDIKSANGEEVNYKGAMAKRVMPPPADSYIEVKPKDSVTVRVDLLIGYDFIDSGEYTIIYTGQNMSRLIVTDSVAFTYNGRQQ
ncbi:MAG: protease [Sphingobacterium sp.]